MVTGTAITTRKNTAARNKYMREYSILERERRTETYSIQSSKERHHCNIETHTQTFLSNQQKKVASFSPRARIFKKTHHVQLFPPSSAGEKDASGASGRRPKSSAATLGTRRRIRRRLARARRDETERFGLEVFLRSEQVICLISLFFLLCNVCN